MFAIQNGVAHSSGLISSMIKNQIAATKNGVVMTSRVGEGRFEIIIGNNFIPEMKRVNKMRADMHIMLDEWLDSEINPQETLTTL